MRHRTLRKLGWVVLGLAVVALIGALSWRVQNVQPTVDYVQTTTTTNPAPDIPPPGVLSGNDLITCSVSAIAMDLDVLQTASDTLFGHFATNQEAELFGTTFYGCQKFTP